MTQQQNHLSERFQPKRPPAPRTLLSEAFERAAERVEATGVRLDVVPRRPEESSRAA